MQLYPSWINHAALILEWTRFGAGELLLALQIGLKYYGARRIELDGHQIIDLQNWAR